MYTQHTSENQKRIIKEALGLNSQAEAIRKGWKLIGEGAFRKAYKKGNIVVKFVKKSSYCSDRDACMREVYYYFKILKPHQRKNFARIYAWRRDRVVQQYYPPVKRGKWSIDDEIKVNRLIEKFNLQDVDAGCNRYGGHNVTMHKGRPICYDMDIESDFDDYYDCNLY